MLARVLRRHGVRRDDLVGVPTPPGHQSRERHGALALTSDTAELPGCRLYIVTVPTPVDARNQPDLGAVLADEGRVHEALALHEQALALREKLHGLRTSDFTRLDDDEDGEAGEIAEKDLWVK